MTKQERDIIITNNPLIKSKFASDYQIKFLNDELQQVFIYARDLVHKGHKLLSHPLSGSIKPNENPFKSILVSADSGSLDFDSLKIIENAILMLSNFPIKYKEFPLYWRDEFATVDLDLISGAIQNHKANKAV